MLQHKGAIGLRKLLSKNVDPPIKKFVDRGLLNRFIQFVKQTSFPQLKLEAAWALTNIAAGQNIYC